MPNFPQWPPTRQALEEINQRLSRIERKVDRIMSEQSTEQQDIDAATAAIGGVETAVTAIAADLSSAASNIQAEIAALKAGNPGVDTTALDAAVAGLSAPITALQSADVSMDALEAPATPPASDTPAA